MVEQNFPAHDGDVPRGGQVAFGIQPAGVFKVGVGHAERSRLFVHHGDKDRFAAADIFGHRHGRIVGRSDADGLEHIVQRHLLAGFEPDLAAAHVVGVFADRNEIVCADAAFLHRLKGQQQRHDLGDGSDGALFVGVLFVQDRTGILVDQNRRLARQIKGPVGGRFDRQRPGGRRRREQQPPAQHPGKQLFHHGKLFPLFLSVPPSYAPGCRNMAACALRHF